jgi:Zn-finger nucleic acid-binding protein
VKIDVCTQCKGVWLDPGELEILAIQDRNPVKRVFGDFLAGLR